MVCALDGRFSTILVGGAGVVDGDVAVDIGVWGVSTVGRGVGGTGEEG